MVIVGWLVGWLFIVVIVRFYFNNSCSIQINTFLHLVVMKGYSIENIDINTVNSVWMLS